MRYAQHFFDFLVSHYTERLKTEQEKGNQAAVAFISGTLNDLGSENRYTDGYDISRFLINISRV